jgi:predicted secreted protein
MRYTLAIALYFVIWWTTLFAVLPFGVRTQGESGDVVAGTPSSAPQRPRILQLFLVNTVVATIVFAIVILAIRHEMLPILSEILLPAR